MRHRPRRSTKRVGTHKLGHSFATSGRSISRYVTVGLPDGLFFILAGLLVSQNLSDDGCRRTSFANHLSGQASQQDRQTELTRIFCTSRSKKGRLMSENLQTPALAAQSIRKPTTV